eukprot:scaffold15993_cov114-Isochrysis_galbana.AAC.2
MGRPFLHAVSRCLSGNPPQPPPPPRRWRASLLTHTCTASPTSWAGWAWPDRPRRPSTRARPSSRGCRAKSGQRSTCCSWGSVRRSRPRRPSCSARPCSARARTRRRACWPGVGWMCPGSPRRTGSSCPGDGSQARSSEAVGARAIASDREPPGWMHNKSAELFHPLESTAPPAPFPSPGTYFPRPVFICCFGGR